MRISVIKCKVSLRATSVPEDSGSFYEMYHRKTANWICPSITAFTLAYQVRPCSDLNSTEQQDAGGGGAGGRLK